MSEGGKQMGELLAQFKFFRTLGTHFYMEDKGYLFCLPFLFFSFYLFGLAIGAEPTRIKLCPVDPRELVYSS